MNKRSGEIKKLVSLLNRGMADEVFYPSDSKNTDFYPDYQQYDNFASEIIETQYTGGAKWGERITYEFPRERIYDMLQWVALRITPGPWMPPDIAAAIQRGELTNNTESAWQWISNLGTAAIELAELEINGIVADRFTGDWAAVDQLRRFGSEHLAVAQDSINGSAFQKRLVQPTEDGHVYCFLPFWFSRYSNTALPLCGIIHPVRIHITLRPFQEVVRRVSVPIQCNESPLGEFVTYTPGSTVAGNQTSIPDLIDARIVLGVTYLDGAKREALIRDPYEVLIEPVTTMHFAEPLKYATEAATSNSVKIALCLTELNGPVRQLLFFLRRKDVRKFNAWSHYGAYLENEMHPIWRPAAPLLQRAVLQINGRDFAVGDEDWWRNSSNSYLSENFIYSYSFARDPMSFSPNGSVNASRCQIRLLLEVVNTPVEWEVVVFGLTHNWLRFQHGAVTPIFKD